ncbi:MAG: ABC transporter substrate-binding protein [Proteobacteria bacterium]|nr:ABC transporter substrate-binding protein [Pseudomonadota bacterium]
MAKSIGTAGVVAATILLSLSLAPLPAAAQGKTLRVALNNDFTTLDPHSNNAFLNNLTLEQIYDCLVTRDKELKPVPALATRWERVEPTRWRFHLRAGVRFHNGAAFSADDVVFSIKRAMAPTSNYTIYIDSVADVARVDDLTVDIVTRQPDAVLVDKLTRIYIMNKAWAEANKSEAPQNFAAKEETTASRQAVGTGPFVLRLREPDTRTVMARNPNWWGEFEGNVEQLIQVPIANDATRVSALLSGDIDFTNFVPFQDLDRLRRDARVKVIDGQENRTLFLGMDQHSDELANSDIKGKNPFKDARVREAVAVAIDIEAIKARMRGQAVPTGSMWTQYVTGWAKDTDRRPPLDRERAKRLLAEAGYANGFKVTLDCPTGTYEQTCVAVAPMLAQIGIDVRVNLNPPAITFQRYAKQETSFYAVSWGVPTFDALYTLRGIIMTRGKVGAGSWNAGGYSNPRVDDLIVQVQGEIDAEKRTAYIQEAHAIHNGEFGHIPLYHLMIPWAMARNVDITHRADNFYLAKWVKVN